MKYLISLLILIQSFIACASIHTIVQTADQSEIKLEKLVKQLPNDGFIVLGEYHNDELIQKAQAKIIESKAADITSASIHWEFLNHTEQMATSTLYEMLLKGEITAGEFIARTAGANNLTYTPIAEIAKKYQYDFFGINLPRSLKQKVIKDGIDSIDPVYVPSTHYTGGENYRERFTDAMGNHVPADMVEAYFVAQCLTDSVMADQAAKNAQNQLNYIIAGSFHTDFYDGTVVRLKNLSQRSVVTFKFINAGSMNQSEIQNITQGHKKYGAYADYIIVVK